MNIRLLTEQDLPAFRALRLRSLQESPEAFGMTEEEFLKGLEGLAPPEEQPDEED